MEQISWDHSAPLKGLNLLDHWYQNYYGFNRSNFSCGRPSRVSSCGSLWQLLMTFRWKQLGTYKKEGCLINNIQKYLGLWSTCSCRSGIFMVGTLIANMIGVEVSWTPTRRGRLKFKICSTLSSHVLVPAIITGVICGFAWTWGMNYKSMLAHHPCSNHSQHLATSCFEWHNGVRYNLRSYVVSHSPLLWESSKRARDDYGTTSHPYGALLPEEGPGDFLLLSSSNSPRSRRLYCICRSLGRELPCNTNEPLDPWGRAIDLYARMNLPMVIEFINSSHDW